MRRNVRVGLAVVVVVLAVAGASLAGYEAGRSPRTQTPAVSSSVTTTSIVSGTVSTSSSTTSTSLPTPFRPVEELQALVDAAGAGGTVVAPSGTYEIPAGDPLILRSGITYDFRASTLLVEPNSATHYYGVLAEGISNFTLMLGTLKGDKEAHSGLDGEWGHALGILGCSDFVVDGGTISDAWGDGVYLGVSGTKQNVNGTLRYLTIYGNRRNNVSVISLDGGKLDSLILLFASGLPPQAGLDIEPNQGARARDIAVTDVMAIGNVGDQIVVSTQSTGGDKEAVPQGITFQRCLADGMGRSSGYGFVMDGVAVALNDCWAANNSRGGLRTLAEVSLDGGNLSK